MTTSFGNPDHFLGKANTQNHIHFLGKANTPNHVQFLGKANTQLPNSQPVTGKRMK
jgi:hypothetical protein